MSPILSQMSASRALCDSRHEVSPTFETIGKNAAQSRPAHERLFALLKLRTLGSVCETVNRHRKTMDRFVPSDLGYTQTARSRTSSPGNITEHMGKKELNASDGV